MVLFLRTKPLGREMLNIQMSKDLVGDVDLGPSPPLRLVWMGAGLGLMGKPCIGVLPACLLPTHQQGKSLLTSGTQKGGLVGWFSNSNSFKLKLNPGQETQHKVESTCFIQGWVLEPPPTSLLPPKLIPTTPQPGGGTVITQGQGG